MELPSPAANDNLVRELQERIKELDCIYAIFDMAVNLNAPFDQIMQDITDRVPLGFQYPESTCARITVNNKVTNTANFKRCRLRLEADITANEKVVGTLEVGYLGAMPHKDSLFLEEEKKLVQTIAAHIGMVVQSKILKDALGGSEKRYRDLIENAPVGIYQTDPRGEISYANETCLRMFGFETLEETMSGGSAALYRNPEDRKTVLEILEQTGKVHNFEVEGVTKTGEPIIVLLSATLESGVVTGTVMDITEHKRANDLLIKGATRLAEAQRVGHLGSWDWDVSTGALHWSDEVYRIFGLLPQEFGTTYEAFLASVHPDDRQAVDEAVNQSLADPGKDYSMEHRVVLPDGSERFVHERGEVTFDKDRRPIRMLGTVHDITRRKQAEQVLKKVLDEIKALKVRLEAENIYLRDEIKFREGPSDIIGTSDPIKYAMHRARQVARTKTTILLTGETGTGKGIFARYIHGESDRRDKPFVNVNCAGLAPNLIESELFGREKGAFTGSTARQIGRFELANNGTIFLDEIGELPLELQTKLLKVIDEGEFERLGSPHTLKVDVRIIASTNRHLEDEIKKGRFRQDLFFRVSVFPITIPPLRQRTEDIPLLVKSFAQKFSKAFGKGINRIPVETMKVLENYAWPGNVRELINIIERAAIVSDGPELSLAEQIATLPVGPVMDESSKGMETRVSKSLVEREREYIRRTLQETNWKVEGPGGAAHVLGLHPSTLRGRMRKLGIRRLKT
jgi:PAS domain S-box-containing protein